MKILLKNSPFSLRLLSLLSMCILITFMSIACGGGIETDQGASLEFSSVTFSETEVGTTDTETLTLYNDGNGDVRITDFKIVADESQAGNHEVFEILTSLEERTTIAPGDDFTIDIEYSPQASEPYNALLTFNSNVPKTASDNYVDEVKISAPTPQPELLVENEPVVFSRVNAGEEASERVEIVNIGSADLETESITLSGRDANDFELTYPGDDIAGCASKEDHADSFASPISPDETFGICVWFTAPDEEFRRAELLVKTNDPDAQPQHLIAVTANSDAPCLEVANAPIDFGLSSIGNANQETVVLQNCSGIADTVLTSLTIGDLEDEDDAESFDENADVPFYIIESSIPQSLLDGDVLALPPESSVSIVIAYEPQEEVEDRGYLQSTSNDQTSPLHTPLFGEGTELDCPIAEAQAAILDSGAWSNQVFGVPLDVIEFDGDGSYDPDGTEVTYEWALTDQPLGSQAQFDDPSSQTPLLETQIAGRFVVELTVRDGAGIASCETAVVEINIEPESDIHVELTWDVPNSQDGTGTDLDLHYLHPSGDWSTEPYGVYWRNQDPDWQDGSDISLDIDSLYGDEPENVNHSDPDPNYDYSTGVFYFSDQVNYGPTDATVRIYLNSTIAFDETRRLENPGDGSIEPDIAIGDFWHVGNFLVDQSGFIDLEVIDTIIEDSGFP